LQIKHGRAWYRRSRLTVCRVPAYPAARCGCPASRPC
jgi:hypothetical protein